MPEDTSALVHDTDVEPTQVAAPDTLAANEDQMEALTAELAKWQERVPKLAGALKLRTTQVSELETQLAALKDAAGTGEQSGAGVRARDELIAELETKQRSLNERNRQAESELHSRALELEELKQESLAWREKWQSMAGDLDTQATQAQSVAQQFETAQTQITSLQGVVAERDRMLESRQRDQQELEEQVRSLESRNDKLFETTELANTQIEAFGDSLASLKSQLNDREAALTELGDTHEQTLRSEAEQQREVQRLEQALADAQSVAEQQRTDHADRSSLAQSEIQSLKELVADQVRALEQLDQESHRLAQDAKATQQAMTDELDAAVAARSALIEQNEQQRSADRQAGETRHAQDLIALDAMSEQARSAAQHDFERRLESVLVEHAEQLTALQAAQATELAHQQIAAEVALDDLSSQARLADIEYQRAISAADVQRLSEQAAAAANLLAVEEDMQAQMQQAQSQFEAETEQLRASAAEQQLELVGQISDQQQQLDRQRGDVAHLQDELQVALESLQGSHEDLQQQVSQGVGLQRQIDDAQSDAYAVRAQLTQQFVAADEAAAQIVVAQTRIAELDSEVNEAKAYSARANDALVQAEQMIDQVNDAHKALQAELEATQAERDLVMVAAESANTDAQSNAATAQALQVELDEARSGLSAGSNEFATLNAEFAALDGNFTALNTDLDSLKAERGLLHGRLLAAEGSLESELERARIAQAAQDAEQARAEAALRSEIDSVEQQLQAQQEQQVADAVAAKARLSELELENADVQTALAHAEQASTDQASQREQLTHRVRELEQKLSYSEEQERAAQALQARFDSAAQALAERDAQVAEHDVQLAQRDASLQELTEAKAQLDVALTTSESNQERLQSQHDALLQEQATLRETLAGYADNADNQLQQRIAITALEAQVAELDTIRSERDSYITTVLTLEDELQALRRQAAETPAAAPASPSSGGVDSTEHLAEVRRLEELIRERTEEANKLRWQLNLNEDAQREADSGPASPAAGGDKMLLVLNQQLQMAQQENQRLAAKVRSFSQDANQEPNREAAPAVPAPEIAVASFGPQDDLTRIRGIGDKLAAQLSELGVTTFAQIADLEPTAIEHAEHPLHSHRSRIDRDDWISQAAALR